MLDNKGFDLWADGYDKSVNLSEEDNEYPFAGYKKVLNYIYGQVKKCNNASVLDIGFGTGILTKKLYDDGYSISGIDFSEKMISIASDKMPSAKLVKWDFSSGLPCEMQTQTFDYIISTYAFHHLQDQEKIEFLKVLSKQLSANGKILIGDISFQTRELHDACKLSCGDDGWDNDEVYFVYDEIKGDFNACKISYTPISYCAGVLVIGK
jgi:putative AdoMet-dependent methyltransferase